jgi:predicted metal-dependent RNase
MQLTIHRGSNQIGGSCVEIATDQTRIILDVGVPLDAMETDFPTPLNVPGLFQEWRRAVDGRTKVVDGEKMEIGL